tara:strand:- start:173 stop:607 length:435 start_codon:yes stop_codon:yes gene_type:complete
MANGTPVRDRLRRMAPGTGGRAKTKRPDAARGKATTKGKLKKLIKGLKPRRVGKAGGMSPGAMGGRTKTKMPDLKRRPITRSPSPMRKQLQGMMPMVGAKGAGASGAAMGAQAMRLARQLKKSGRLSVDDLMRAKKAMMNRKGK